MRFHTFSMIDILLKISIFSGWISGCFPVSTQSSGNRQNDRVTLVYKRFSFINLYSILILVLNVVFGISFSLVSSSGSDKIDDVLKTRHFSEFLMDHGLLIMFLTMDLIRRTLALLSCRKTVYVLELYKRIKNNGFHSKPFGPSLSLIILICTAFFFFTIKKTLSMVTFYFHQTIINKTPALVITDSKWVILGSSIFQDVTANISAYFTFGVTSLLGICNVLMLRNHYLTFTKNFLLIYSKNKSSHLNCASELFRSKPFGIGMENRKDFKNRKHSIFVTTGLDLPLNNMLANDRQLLVVDTIEKLTTYMSELKKIQKSFAYFDKFAGIYGFTFVVEKGFAFIYCVNNALEFDSLTPILGGRCSAIVGAVEALVILYSLSHLGSFMKNTIEAGKEELRNALLEAELESRGRVDKMVKATTKSILEWNWTFTANNLFDIDYSLLPAIAGTMMTYIIFMFQLKMSESNPPEKHQGH